MDVVIQIVGSLLILVPFVLTQLRRMKSSGRAYLLLNLIGSTVLAIDAGVHAQWGFLLLEGVWAIVSLIGLVRSASAASDPQRPTAHADPSTHRRERG